MLTITIIKVLWRKIKTYKASNITYKTSLKHYFAPGGMVTKIINGAEEYNNKNTQGKDMGILKSSPTTLHRCYFIYIILISSLTTSIHGQMLKGPPC